MGATGSELTGTGIFGFIETAADHKKFQKQARNVWIIRTVQEQRNIYKR
jgi:hypothetical protein